jgi:molecular chaperone GrpE
MAPAPVAEPGSAGPAPGPPGGAEAAPSAEAGLAALRADLERARAREDELLRALAEMTNVQKRRRQEMDNAILYAAEPLLRELLPVLDDLERALAALEGREDDPLRTGVALVQDRLWRTLEREGLEAFRPLGAPFDPELQDALMQRSAPEFAPHTVLEVVKPGYRYKGRVLRHAQVVVAAEGSRESGPVDAQAPAPGPPGAEENRT